MTFNELRDHLAAIKTELKRSDLTTGERSRLDEEADETRRHMILARDLGPGSCETGDGAGDGVYSTRRDDAPPHLRDARDRALRAISRHADALTAVANNRLDRLVRIDPTGVEARYLAAVADPDYGSAFGKLLKHPLDAMYRMTPAEVAAVQAVTQSQSERAMSIGGSGGADGGFGVPYALDPTILLSGDGTINPMRQVARVITITTDVWKGVASEGVSAHWYAESAEVSDDTPTLAQPEVTVRRASAFIPFTIEVGMDYAGLQAELGRLFADAKDSLEAQAFLDGLAAGNAPIGILAATGGLGASQKVETEGSNAFTTSDCYDLKAEIPPRFAPRSIVLGAPATFDAVYRFVGGNSDEPPILPTRDGAFLGLPVREWANMATGTADGAQILIAGDVREAYTIVDRIGMSVELVPHVFGSSHRPTGERGLFAFWRVGAAVVNANAARFLQIKA